VRGYDIVVESRAGMGKTAIYCIGICERIDTKDNTDLQALILLPTRELVYQLTNIVASIGKYHGVISRSFMGGVPVRESIATLKAGLHVAVGTPGRVYDLVDRKAMDLSRLKVFVLDDVQDLWDRGYEETLRNFFTVVPRDVQITMFSCYMPRKIFELTKHHLHDPIEINKLSLKNVQQFYVFTEENLKLATLFDLYEKLKTNTQKSVIFCNSLSTVGLLYKEMTNKGFSISAAESTNIYITSLFGAKSPQQVPLVINFDIFPEMENYLHRVGKSEGRKGVAISFVTERTNEMIGSLESFFHTSITEMPPNICDFLS